MIIDKENVEDIYPMSEISKGMIYHSILDASVNAYYDQVIHQVEVENFDYSTFDKTMAHILQRHHNLRSIFNFDKFEEPVHIVLKKIDYKILHENISDLSREEQENKIKRYLIEDKKLGFKHDANEVMWRAKVYILSSSKVCLVWTIHHAISDGWSNTILFKDIVSIYRTLITNPDFLPTPLESSYKDFIILEQKAIKDQALHNFWIEELKDCKSFVFPGKRNRSEPISYFEYDLSENFNRINELSKKHSIPLKSLCFAAYTYAISLLTYENDFVVGLINHNRPISKDADKIFGCFLNTVPFRVKIDSDQNWKQYIHGVCEKMNKLKSYELLPLSQIQKVIGHKPADGELINTIFNFIDFNTGRKSKRPSQKSAGNENLDIEWFEATNTLLDFTVNTTNNNFSISFRYYKSVITKELIAKLVEYFINVINAFESFPDQVCQNSDILGEMDNSLLLDKFNNTSCSYSGKGGIIDLFEEKVKENPNQVAIEIGDQKINYLDFSKRVNQLIRSIEHSGVKKGEVVALLSERSIEMMVGIFAIIKMGAVYLPIDPKFPKERIKYMLTDSNTKTVLCQEKYISILSSNEKIINLQSSEIASYSDSDIATNYSLNDIAYIMYTSGSTGNPKGVLISHDSLLNLIFWLSRAYPINVDDRILQSTTISFDISICELFWWCIEGSTLVLLKPDDEKQPVKIIESILEKNITVYDVVPSILKLILEAYKEISHTRKINSLKYVFACGEALETYVVNTFNDLLLEKSGVKLVNVYGPTEATVYASYYNCYDLKEHTLIPIGKPMDNLKLFVVNKNHDLLPIGVPGELCIVGTNLALGYLNQISLTTDKFILSKFLSNVRMYKTGDIACWRDDGDIEFFGRIDNQVKINGFRIELGEIESVIKSIEGIEQVVVITVTPDHGIKKLVAYYKSKKMISPMKMRSQLNAKLPSYMVPNQFIKVASFKLKNNGKIDLKQLINLSQQQNSTVKDNNLLPGSELEIEIAEIWKEFIEVDRVLLSDNYFDIGGNSLLIFKISAKLKKKFGVEPAFDTYFSNSFEYFVKEFQKRIKVEKEITV